MSGNTITGLSINIHLSEIFASDSVLSGMTTDIYPIIAEEDVNFPFVLHTRENISPMDSKQALIGDTITFAVAVVSDKYAQTVEIAERIRKLLEKRRDGYFQSCNMISASEEYTNDAYVQRLRFSGNIFNNNNN